MRMYKIFFHSLFLYPTSYDRISTLFMFLFTSLARASVYEARGYSHITWHTATKRHNEHLIGTPSWPAQFLKQGNLLDLRLKANRKPIDTNAINKLSLLCNDEVGKLLNTGRWLPMNFFFCFISFIYYRRNCPHLALPFRATLNENVKSYIGRKTKATHRFSSAVCVCSKAFALSLHGIERK